MKSFFKDFGTGVGLRPSHYSEFLKKTPDSVSWLEVISENFMPWQNGNSETEVRAFQNLEKVRTNLPVFLHGVSMNLGSCDDLDFDYLKKLKDLVQKIDPAIVSDHLCWTGVKGFNVHDLLPVPYTFEALQLMVEKIDRVQNFLGRRILIENPSSYLEFTQSEMSEWDFLKTLTEKADCGLLLDINNIYVSSVNHNFDPLEYLRTLPQERIGQIHLAGHSTMKGGYLIDTHDHPVCDEVWDLYRWSVNNFGTFSTMIERDDNIPEWQELEKEVLTIQRIRDEEIKKSF
ncbi:MAG: MNIO family bufferin maturase [Bdellovibrio sp.]